jgi:hypothetical protein
MHIHFLVPYPFFDENFMKAIGSEWVLSHYADFGIRIGSPSCCSSSATCVFVHGKQQIKAADGQTAATKNNNGA